MNNGTVKNGNQSTHSARRHEGDFCPVTCPMSELDAEIAAISDQNCGNANYGIFKFLEGVRHARIILSGGKAGQ